MSAWRLITLICATSILVETKSYNKREASIDICDELQINPVLCYCYKHNSVTTRADCYLTSENVQSEDTIWEGFEKLQSANSILFTNTRGKILKFIPMKALNYTKKLTKLQIKYAQFGNIPSYAFSNLSTIEELNLPDNQIEALAKNAFAYHERLKVLSLDQNKIQEINRDVFIHLPSLEKLFLTHNEINVIHDKAFVHLSNLKELEIDRNKIFSLNSESFTGLHNLHRLDLRANSLEVIGDNTFKPLTNLRSLNLDNNKIEILDDRAFNGLINLESLSLSKNKLTVLRNDKNFQGLNNLKMLNLQGNQIKEFKLEVIKPILQNFYQLYSSLDIEDNDFPCTCQLDWFLDLMNNTQNNRTKLALNNLKCEPDAKIRENYDKIIEKQKEEEKDLPESNDEEYYDETQLGGKLFYTDLRDLLNCSRTDLNVLTELDSGVTPKTITTVSPRLISSASDNNQITTTYSTVQSTTPLMSNTSTPLITNQGVLDLSLDDTTVKTTHTPKIYHEKVTNVDEDRTIYTTTRLATVSAKPKRHFDDAAEISRKHYDNHQMASDEAVPESTKGHKRDYPSEKLKNNSSKTYSCAFLIITLLCTPYF